MEHRQGSISDLEEEARFVTNAVNGFARIVQGYKVDVQNIELQTIIKKVRQHYDEHREAYKNELRITKGDIYKIISWVAMFMYHDIRDKRILKAACAYMNRQLHKDGRNIPPKTSLEIVNMLSNDNKKDNVAVGKNGLYMAFKCASEVELCYSMP